MSKIFQNVAGLRPSRTAFDLSYNKIGTCRFGELIPVMCEEVVPGDKWHIGHEMIIRFFPMLTPILHEIDVTIHDFFVPYRLLTQWYYDPVTVEKRHRFDWEQFITGGINGKYPQPLPRWKPGVAEVRRRPDYERQSLWDMFGFPVEGQNNMNGASMTTSTLYDITPIIFPKWAYNLIFFEYYIDMDIDFAPVTGLDVKQPAWDNIYTQFRRWRKDYFTSARPWPQRGDAPSFPLRGDIPVQSWFDENELRTVPILGPGVDLPAGFYDWWMSYVTGTARPWEPNIRTDGTTTTQPSATGGDGGLGVYHRPQIVRLGDAVSFNVNDLRNVIQVQKWLERNARAGIRYIEFLKAHFGVSPSDSRLDRPEYIGGVHVPIQVSEVLQTSQSTQDSPLADMGGHGLGASRGYSGSYNVEEFGLIMSLMSVMPKAGYQQGINRQWLRFSRYDFYFPEFAHLGEQAIFRAELFWQGLTVPDANQAFQGNTLDSEVFGFNGRYDEMRIKHDMVVGDMRHQNFNAPGQSAPLEDLSEWHLYRNFENHPALGTPFIELFSYHGWEQAFTVTNRRPIIFHVRNVVRAIRPLPYIAEPGLVDHF